MVNPRKAPKETVEIRKGIPRHLLCAPFALALTAAIPMGAAYADEVVAPVESDSSTPVVEVSQDVQSDVDDATESEQTSQENNTAESSEDETTSTDSTDSTSSTDSTGSNGTSSNGSSSSSSDDGSTSDDQDGDDNEAADGDNTDGDDNGDIDATDPAASEEEELIAPVAANGNTEVQVTGEYKQSEARKMLELVNADRENNNVQDLSWDYALEQYAMQRAAEILYYFSHTRPNGEPFSNELMSYGYYSVGENLHQVMNSTNVGAVRANQAWIDSTGHHINRTKAKWQGYAAACLYLPNVTYVNAAGQLVTGPIWCWVELFSTPNGNPNYVAPVDGARTKTVVLDGDNYRIIETTSLDNGKNGYSLGWYYDEAKDKFTYIREVTYTSYVPKYVGITGMIDGVYYTFDTEGFLTKESEKDLPFTREQFLGLTTTRPGDDPTKQPQSSNSNQVSVINTKSSRSDESLTRITPGAILDEYGYTLYVTSALRSTGAHWETQGNRTVFRLADGSLATGWVVDGGQRFYLDSNGALAKGWRRIGDAWYFFDLVDGTMKTGLFEYNGERYFTNAKGVMQTGLVEIDGKRYFAELSGALREV